MRTLFLTALTLGLAALPTAAQDLPLVGGKVPFKLLPSQHMLIELKLNGKGPFKVIFDTGAPLNLVTSKLAKEAGITKGKQSAFSFLSGPQVIQVDDAKLGDVSIPKLPVIVMDHPTVRSISNAFEEDFGRIDGIVGFPLFARFATTIDYKTKQLTFKPTDYKPGDFLQELTDSITKAADQQGPRVVGGEGLWGFQTAIGGDGKSGVEVRSVVADGPAAKAGLKVGDRVVTVEGRWTDTLGDLALATASVKPGRTAEFVVRRGAEMVMLKCVPVAGY